jgi:hypothetical protein
VPEEVVRVSFTCRAFFDPQSHCYVVLRICVNNKQTTNNGMQKWKVLQYVQSIWILDTLSRATRFSGRIYIIYLCARVYT